MRTALLLLSVLVCLTRPVPAAAQLPPPPAAWADWPTAWNPDDPGELAADGLLDRPAGRRGGVVARDGHFYSGDARVRFWGVNLAFGANFPTHDLADQLARRFSRYGINAVRFHHMDNQPFPNGIFADRGLEKLSPEALDRLDYFVAALKARGVYADLNLHVSRNYSHYHRTADGHDGPRVDKIVDLFDPDLIAAQRRYAADLLTHVNAYTGARYADEPSVGLVEINNENSLFMWGAEGTIAALPEPYAGELRRQWNGWLTHKYADRAKLAAAWQAGATPDGPLLLGGPGAWRLEQHDRAAASLAAAGRGVQVTVTRPDGVAWHVQAIQAGLTLHKGQSYRVRFTVRSDRPATVTASVGQAHAPWQVAASRTVHVTPAWQTVTFGVTAPADDANARLSFAVGGAAVTVELADVDLHAGGPAGLAADEDLGTVRPAADDARGPRHDDWYTFLEQTEETYYTAMRDYLHKELGVRCPVTGTIGFGPLGTYAQRDMDYVDAHAYWQHPTFPGKPWDPADWTIPNTPMVDDPAHATLWSLAATRVAGKPFTVTEYQHPAPSDWAAECVPEIASFAALQDWDAVFLFAYSHNDQYDKGRIASFFDIEGNPTKMPLMPMGARLFLGGAVSHEFLDGGPADGSPIMPDSFTYTVTPAAALAGGSGTDMAGFLRAFVHARYLDDPVRRTSIRFLPGMETTFGMSPGDPVPRRRQLKTYVNEWHAEATSARLSLDRTGAIVDVWAGGRPATSPFGAVVVVPSDPSKPIASADKLLVTAVARARNADEIWNAGRISVGTHWGHAPVQIEVVHADVTVPGRWSHAWALDPAGKPTAVDVAEPSGADTVLHLGRSTALAYVVER